MKLKQLVGKQLGAALFALVLLTGGAILPGATVAKAAVMTVPPSAPISYVVHAGDTLSAIAQRYGSSVQALMNLNQLTSTTIYVGQQLVIAREQLPGTGIDTLYTVVRGDTLSALAQRYNTTVSSIMNANGLSSTTIYVGQTLAMPRDFPAGPIYPVSYVVRAGDTLSGIAQRYGTTVQAMIEVNQLSSTLIYIGQPLTISVATAPDMQPTRYIVRRGDTLSGIAQQANVTVASIMALNGLTSTMLYVGQTLLIPVSLGYPLAEQ